MSEVPLNTIVEVEECGLVRANFLIQEHSGVLLGVFGNSYAKPRRQPGPGTGPTFIAHGIRYVIGRRRGYEPFPPPKKRIEEPEVAETNAS